MLRRSKIRFTIHAFQAIHAFLFLWFELSRFCITISIISDFRNFFLCISFSWFSRSPRIFIFVLSWCLPRKVEKVIKLEYSSHLKTTFINPMFNHGTIIRTRIICKKFLYKSLLNSALLWSRAWLAIKKKQISRHQTTNLLKTRFMSLVCKKG